MLLEKQKAKIYQRLAFELSRAGIDCTDLSYSLFHKKMDIIFVSDATGYGERKLRKTLVLFANITDRVNALTFVECNYNVIVIFWGVIRYCYKDINLLSLHPDAFIQFEETEIINFRNETKEAVRELNAQRLPEISFEESGICIDFNSNTKSNAHLLAIEFITEIAVRFALLHEIGHHKKKHNGGKNANLCRFAVKDEDFNNKTNVKFLTNQQESEVEADLYAIRQLSREFDLYVQKYTAMFEVSDLECIPEVFYAILSGIAVVFFNMPYDGALAESIEVSDYPQQNMRELTSLFAFSLRCFKNNKFRNAILEHYETDEKLQKSFSDWYPDSKWKTASNRLSKKAVAFYTVSLFLRLKSMYCDIKAIPLELELRTLLKFINV